MTDTGLLTQLVQYGRAEGDGRQDDPVRQARRYAGGSRDQDLRVPVLRPDV